MTTIECLSHTYPSKSPSLLTKCWTITTFIVNSSDKLASCAMTRYPLNDWLHHLPMVNGWVGGCSQNTQKICSKSLKTEICKQKLYRNLWIEFLSLMFPEFPEAKRRRRRRRRRSRPSPWCWIALKRYPSISSQFAKGRDGHEICMPPLPVPYATLIILRGWKKPRRELRSIITDFKANLLCNKTLSLNEVREVFLPNLV